MNRIQLLDSQADSKSKTQLNQLSSATLDIAESHHSDSNFFIPLHYESNYAYPLVVWLHGPGGNEQQISRVMPHVSLRNYVAVAPRATLRDEAYYESDVATYTWSQEADHVGEAADRVAECIELASSRFNIARRRVFLAGYDAGGTMALRLGLLQPELFAGVVSLGGEIPRMGNVLLNVSRARQLPVMIMHCRDSEEYTEDHVCADLRLLHSAGLSITLRQYPCQQEVTTQMLADLDVWLMENVTGENKSDQSGMACERVEGWN